MTEHANVVVVTMTTFYILFIMSLTELWHYHECQHITDIQVTATDTHHTETANRYQRFIPTAISKSKRKLTAFQN